MPRPKKGGRVVTENIKVTKETHTEMKEIASVLRLTMSQVGIYGARKLKEELARQQQTDSDLFSIVNKIRKDVLDETDSDEQE